jgi:glycosyltransferase involved in cell wall biosynthesis
VGGRRKAELIAGARALLFPIRWDEPFGIVVAEAMVSGTPVITTPRGSMPELVTPDVGFLCQNESELEEAIRRVGDVALSRLPPARAGALHQRRVRAQVPRLLRAAPDRP